MTDIVLQNTETHLETDFTKSSESDGIDRKSETAELETVSEDDLENAVKILEKATQRADSKEILDAPETHTDEMEQRESAAQKAAETAVLTTEEVEKSATDTASAILPDDTVSQNISDETLEVNENNMGAKILTITTEKKKGIVTGAHSTLNVREAPTTNSYKVGSVKEGTEVSVIDEEVDSNGWMWYQIEFLENSEKITGFVLSDYIKLAAQKAAENEVLTAKEGLTSVTDTTSAILSDETVSLNTSDETSEVNESSIEAKTLSITMGGKTGIVLAKTAFVRETPTSKSCKVGSLEEGMEIWVIDEVVDSDDLDGQVWYQIEFLENSERITGFVRSDLIMIKKVKYSCSLLIQEPEDYTGGGAIVTLMTADESQELWVNEKVTDFPVAINLNSFSSPSQYGVVAIIYVRNVEETVTDADGNLVTRVNPQATMIRQNVQFQVDN